jgi:anti-sigma B factor antagonist
MTLEMKSFFNSEMNQWKLEVKGEIDVFTAKNLREKIKDIYNKKQKDIILDFKQLNYIDSTGLGVIIGAYGRMKEKNNNLIIINAKQNVLKLLTITGLDKILIKTNF